MDFSPGITWIAARARPSFRPLLDVRDLRAASDKHDARGKVPGTTPARSVPNEHALPYSLVRRSSWALMATITVLADISTAPSAGDSTTPREAKTPAASGIATML